MIAQIRIWSRFRRTTAVAVASGVLLAAAAGAAPAPAMAATSCAVWATTAATNGNYVWGYSYIDCPTSPQSDWVKGEIVLQFVYPQTKQSCINNINSSLQQACQTYYYCNGTGNNEWFQKAKGRDLNGGESAWIEGTHATLLC